MASRFGQALKQWRKQRGRTQLDLALISGYSQRHLSFLESGRSRPTRATVVILAESLDVPLRERNTLLHAAGFAPVYTAEPLDSERLRHALAALETVVESHRPFPALIVDRAWNVRGGNANAFALFQRFIEQPLVADPQRPVNAMRLCIDAAGLRPHIRNWAPFMAALVGQLRTELLRAEDAELRSLIERIENDPEYRAHGRASAGRMTAPVATLLLEAEGTCLELFTLHSSFATVSDANLAELRVETFFPADDASRAVLEALDVSLDSAQGDAHPAVAAWRDSHASR